jgi:hypothetical protein
MIVPDGRNSTSRIHILISEMESEDLIILIHQIVICTYGTESYLSENENLLGVPPL